MLEIDYEFRKGILFIRLNGIFNKETSYKLSKKLDKFINTMGIKYFVINIENVSYMDKTSIEILKNKYEDVSMHNGKLILCGYQNAYLTKIKEAKGISSITNELAAFKLIRI